MGTGVFIVGFFLGCLAGVCDGPGCGSTGDIMDQEETDNDS